MYGCRAVVGEELGTFSARRATQRPKVPGSQRVSPSPRGRGGGLTGPPSIRQNSCASSSPTFSCEAEEIDPPRSAAGRPGRRVLGPTESERVRAVGARGEGEGSSG